MQSPTCAQQLQIQQLPPLEALSMFVEDGLWRRLLISEIIRSFIKKIYRAIQLIKKQEIVTMCKNLINLQHLVQKLILRIYLITAQRLFLSLTV